MTRQRTLIATLLAADAEARASAWDRHPAVEQAKRHLASLTPERRAMLEAEWSASGESV